MSEAAQCKDCGEQPALRDEDYCDKCIGLHTCAGCGLTFEFLIGGLLCAVCSLLDEQF